MINIYVTYVCWLSGADGDPSVSLATIAMNRGNGDFQRYWPCTMWAIDVALGIEIRKPMRPESITCAGCLVRPNPGFSHLFIKYMMGWCQGLYTYMSLQLSARDPQTSGQPSGTRGSACLRRQKSENCQRNGQGGGDWAGLGGPLCFFRVKNLDDWLYTYYILLLLYYYLCESCVFTITITTNIHDHTALCFLVIKRTINTEDVFLHQSVDPAFAIKLVLLWILPPEWTGAAGYPDVLISFYMLRLGKHPQQLSYHEFGTFFFPMVDLKMKLLNHWTINIH